MIKAREVRVLAGFRNISVRLLLDYRIITDCPNLLHCKLHDAIIGLVKGIPPVSRDLKLFLI